MKRKLIRAMTDVDDAFVEEAAPKAGRKRKVWVRIAAVAACVAILVTSFCLWAFIPYDLSPPNVSHYRNSEYYAVISALNTAMYKNTSDRNNFEKYLSGWFAVKATDVPSGKLEWNADAPEAAVGESYEEITDNQVAGVIEGDIIKRSDEKIFYYSPQTGMLSVYSIAREDSALLTSCDVQAIMRFYFGGDTSRYIQEFYLSPDCMTVTFLAQNYWTNCTELLSLDVSDLEKLGAWKEKNNSDVVQGYTSVEGSYKTSRYVNGSFLLMTVCQTVTNDISFDDAATFIPAINDNGEEILIRGGDITVPEVLNGTAFTVICSLDSETLSVEGSHALLSYVGDFYVTADRVYATNGFTRYLTLDGRQISSRMTEITAISYEEGMEKVGTVALNGYIKDQYSLDEYNGVLRVVTSIDESMYSSKYYQEKVTASLYCLDADTLETVASVLHFAPSGETVRSVRFDKDNAYVCTAVQVTDPVFFFDLSDLENITVKDTGNIEGFSTSLVDFGGGYLLGIGQGAFFDTVKIEVYREGEDQVESVAVLEFADTFISSLYKAYYIDRENQLIGMGFCTAGSEEGYGYMVLHFNGVKLTVAAELSFGQRYSSSVDYMRGVYIDGYFYCFSGNEFRVVALTVAG